MFEPQHQTWLPFMPHVYAPPTAMVLNVRDPETAVGTRRSIVVPSPSAPVAFQPQQSACLVPVSAHVCPIVPVAPAGIATRPPLPNTPPVAISMNFRPPATG